MQVFEAGQLSMLGSFEKSDKQVLQLVKHLLENIANLKFIRTQIDLSLPGSATRLEALQYYNSLLDSLAVLTYKVSAGLPEYKDKDLEYFLDKTRVKQFLSLSELRSNTELYQMVSDSGSRLNGLLNAYKRHLAPFSGRVKDITDYLAEVKRLFYERRGD